MFKKKHVRVLPLFSSFFLPIIIAISLTACGAGGGGNSDSGMTNNESNSIGSNGGAVTSSDGKAKIVIPSGALSQDIGITVAAMSNQPSGNIGTAYEFGPDGTAFSKAVTISISYDEKSLPSGVSESDIKLGMVTNNQWQEITNSIVDTVTNIVSGTTSHLSIYGVMAVSSSDTAPAAPTGVIATAGDGQVTISWNTVSGATSYNIYWSTTSGITKGTGTKISNVTSPYIHMGRTNETTYYYVVTAINSYGESSESSQVSATPSLAGAVPAAPSGVAAAAGDGKAIISWDDVSGTASYNIYWSTTSGVSKTSYTGKITGAASSYPHAGLINGASYYYVITAVNSYGESSESSQVSATPTSSVFPDTTAPSNTTGSNFSNSGAASTNLSNVTLSISATDIVGVTGYYVSEISTAPSAGAAGWVSVTSVTSYSTNVFFTMSSGDGPKTLHVWFKDAAGNVSTEKSDTITLDTTAPSNPTTILGYSSSSKTAALTSGNWYNYVTPYFEWNGASDSSSGVAGYYVYFGVDATADPAISGTYQTSANYTVSTALTAGSTYYLLIKVRDNAGNIASSTYTAFTYQYDSSGPTNITGSSFINNGASSTNSTTVTLTLSATDDVGVTGYCTKESSATPSDNDTCWTSITSTTSYSAGVTFTLSSGEGIKTVYVWFKDAAGNISSAANDSITLGSPPSAPTAVTATVSDGQVTIGWNVVSGATSYNIYWSITAGVTKSTGTKISNVTSPYTHTGRTNGTTYYYVVAAVNDFGESEESSQISATPQVPIRLPKTGQTTCYNNLGNVIACSGTGQDGDLQAGVAWPSPRFTDNGDGTITDNLTGLVWAKDGNAPGPAACSPGKTKTWQVALDYVACLNTHSYLGHTDWRLPNVNEIESLVNRGQADTSLWLNTQGFINVQSRYYWSSTSGAGGAWIVLMWIGYIDAYWKFGDHYVWPVRSGQYGLFGYSIISLPKTGQTSCFDSYGNIIACTGTGQDGNIQAGATWPAPRFTDNRNGTVTDNLTGLVWTKDANTPGPAPCSPLTKKTWQGTLDYVACLNTNSYLGYTDWRLPNVNELRSLVNADQSIPATWLENEDFNNVQWGSYWSSTSSAGDTFNAWIVDMLYGHMNASSKSYDSNVWPVRSGQ